MRVAGITLDAAAGSVWEEGAGVEWAPTYRQGSSPPLFQRRVHRLQRLARVEWSWVFGLGAVAFGQIPRS